MKKILALAIAAFMLVAAVPALAFTGYETAPAMPETETVDEPLFDYDIIRMENDPEVSETPWGETYNTWVPMGSDPKAEVGEAVTYAVEYAVPETIEGFDAESLKQISFLIDFVGLDSVEIVEASGLEPNQTCDYEAGYCYPLPGYYNARVEGGVIVVEPKLSTTVQIIVRGVVAADEVVCSVTQTVGQDALPTHYSVGKVEAIEGGYYVYDKDFTAVQIRGMKFFTEGENFDHYYVCLNDIDYIRSAYTKGVSYTRVDDPSVVFTEGTKFDALERGYNDVMGFFGFTDDDIKDVMTDSVFLDGSEPVSFAEEIELMTDGEEPVEPTDEPAPVDPTDEPAPVDPSEPGGDEPAPIAPPQTGAVSVAVFGIVSVLAGAGVVLFRRRK